MATRKHSLYRNPYKTGHLYFIHHLKSHQTVICQYQCICFFIFMSWKASDIIISKMKGKAIEFRFTAKNKSNDTEILM